MTRPITPTFFFKLTIYYMGLIGRLWQIQCIYLDNEMQLTKRKRKKRGRKEKRN